MTSRILVAIGISIPVVVAVAIIAGWLSSSDDDTMNESAIATRALVIPGGLEDNPISNLQQLPGSCNRALLRDYSRHGDADTQVVTTPLVRGGVTVGVPPNITLAPDRREPADDTLWFFSSALDRIDPYIGVRAVLAVYPTPSQYPRSSVAVLSDGSPIPFATVDEALDGFDDGTLCSIPVESLDVPYSHRALFTTTAEGDTTVLSHQALVALPDERLVLVRVDGLPDVVSGGTQYAIFKSIAEGVLPAP
jgi:hypothetical protein